MKRIWRWLALLGMLFLSVPLMWGYLGPREPDPPGNHRVEAEQHLYYPGGSECRPERLARRAGPKVQVEIERCTEAAEEHRLKQNDLAQQTRSADAAEAVAKQSFLQTKALALATVLGFLTLVAALLAAFFARNAALEAGRSVKDSRAQTRAYITVGSVLITVHRTGPSDSIDAASVSALKVAIKLQNIGNTRATDVHLTVKMVWGDEIALEPFGDHPTLLPADGEHTWHFTGGPMDVLVEDINAGATPPLRIDITVHSQSIYGERVDQSLAYEGSAIPFNYFAGEGIYAPASWNYSTGVGLVPVWRP